MQSVLNGNKNVDSGSSRGFEFALESFHVSIFPQVP